MKIVSCQKASKVWNWAANYSYYRITQRCTPVGHRWFFILVWIILINFFICCTGVSGAFSLYQWSINDIGDCLLILWFLVVALWQWEHISVGIWVAQLARKPIYFERFNAKQWRKVRLKCFGGYFLPKSRKPVAVGLLHSIAIIIILIDNIYARI